MSKNHVALALEVLGSAVLVAGVGLVSVALALIVAGMLLLAFAVALQVGD